MVDKSTDTNDGWAWIVVVAYFFLNVITDGMQFSFGFLFIEFIDAFNLNRGQTAWVISLRTGVKNVCGPIAGMLVNRFGCRPVATSGALLWTAGYISSVFTTDIRQMYVTLGVLPGMGIGLMHLSATVSVIRYFTTRRSLATGISMCGSGVGGFTFNPLTKALIDAYGWRGTLLVEAGLSLNCFVAGTIFRPVGDLKPGNKNKNKTELKRLMKIRAEGKEISDKMIDRDTELEIFIPDDTHRDHEVCETQDSKQRPEKNADTSAQSDRPNNCLFCSVLSSFVTSIVGAFHLELLKDIGLLLFLLGNLITTLAYGLPYTYLPDMAVKRGFSRQDAVWLVSALTIANTISRVLTGFLADRRWFKRVWGFNCAFLAAGVISGLLPVLQSYGLMMLYSIIYGTFTGSFVMLWPVVLADLFGDEKIADSFGLSMFSAGIGGFFGAPLAGWLFDNTGSYDITFVVAGAELVLAGLILRLIPLTQRCRLKGWCP